MKAKLVENTGLGAELVNQLLQNPFIGICITDADGVCLMLNDAHTRISGMPPESFIGKNMGALVGKNVLSVSSTAEVLKTGREVNLHQTNAGNKAYDVKGVPVYDEHGKIKYVISYLLDVSDIESFKSLVDQLQADKEKAENQIKKLTEAQRMDGEIVFYGNRMKKTIDLAKKLAKRDSSVLICGPSGSGKELIANLIHETSNRSGRPFVKINCAAIPEHLLESELFGYEAGAFTGGNPKGSKGIFEAANGGSLLLDEIGEMPLHLQAKLLRVLQNQEVRRIGSDIAIQVEVRIMAATNAPLIKLIEEKKFREDLYYRLNVVELIVPGLEQRQEDIPILITHFVRLYNSKYDEKKNIRWDGIRYLMARSYPGNIRELKNVVERILIQSTADEITADDVAIIVDEMRPEGQGAAQHFKGLSLHGRTLKELMDDYEKEILEEGLHTFRNAETAAKKLGVDRSTMSRKLYKHGLK